MTTEEFKSFIREFRMLMHKYNVRVKADSEEIEFGITGTPHISDGRCWVERASGILFIEILTPEEANKEEEEGNLIIGG